MGIYMYKYGFGWENQRVVNGGFSSAVLVDG
jgi:hypothetical protein